MGSYTKPELLTVVVEKKRGKRRPEKELVDTLRKDTLAYLMQPLPKIGGTGEAVKWWGGILRLVEDRYGGEADKLVLALGDTTKVSPGVKAGYIALSLLFRYSGVMGWERFNPDKPVRIFPVALQDDRLVALFWVRSQALSKRLKISQSEWEQGGHWYLDRKLWTLVGGVYRQELILDIVDQANPFPKEINDLKVPTPLLNERRRWSF